MVDFDELLGTPVELVTQSQVSEFRWLKHGNKMKLQTKQYNCNDCGHTWIDIPIVYAKDINEHIGGFEPEAVKSNNFLRGK